MEGTEASKKEMTQRVRAVMRAVKFGNVTIDAGLEDMLALISAREEALVAKSRAAQQAAEREAQLLRSLEYVRM